MIDNPRSRTVFAVSVASVMLIVTPVVRLAKMTPVAPRPSMVTDRVIVTAPNPPGSSTLISPFVAVLENAPLKVLHGAVRLQGKASSPVPETQVRLACA